MDTFTDLDIKKSSLIKRIKSIAEMYSHSFDDVCNSFLLLFFTQDLLQRISYSAITETENANRIIDDLSTRFSSFKKSLMDYRFDVSSFYSLFELVYEYTTHIVKTRRPELSVNGEEVLRELFYLSADCVNDEHRFELFDVVFKRGKYEKIDDFIRHFAVATNPDSKLSFQEIPLVAGEAAITGKVAELAIDPDEDISFYMVLRALFHNVHMIQTEQADVLFIRDFRASFFRKENHRHNHDGNAFEYVTNKLRYSTMRHSWSMVLGSGKIKNYERKSLYLFDLLYAVIELPKQYKSRLKNLYLFGSRKNTSANVLFIKTDLIYPVLQQRDDLLAVFLVQLLNIEDSTNFFPLLNIDDNKKMDYFINRFFPSGYKDVPGLVSEVPVEVLMDTSSFSVDKFVSKSIENEALFSPLDDQLIYSSFSDIDKIRGCYIIGNNGVGKSLLLFRLANRFLSAGGRNILLLSSGLSDRFYMLRNKPRAKYLGDKQSGGRISFQRRNVEITQRVIAIHKNGVVKPFFEEILSEIGFTAELYYVPVSFTLNSKHLYDLSDIIKFSAAYSENIDEKKYVIAIKRKGNEQILAFDNLSSGEQQLLLMFARIISVITQGDMLIIDEPEVSMHVAWQQKLPYIFDLIAKKFFCHFVVATHSPLLINSVEPDNNLSFIAEDGILSKLPQSPVRNVEATILDKFHVVTRNNRGIYEKCAKIVSDFMCIVNSHVQSEDVISSDDLYYIENEKIKAQIKIDDILKILNENKYQNLENEIALVSTSQRAIDELYKNIINGRG